MKLGIIYPFPYIDKESFAFAQKLGLDGLEFTVDTGNKSEDFVKTIPSLKLWKDKYHQNILSMGRWGSCRVDDDGNINEAELQNDLNLINAASELACPVFNCGCNYAKNRTLEENYDIAISYFKKLVEYGNSKNVKIAVYNCHWENYVTSPKEWDAILPKVPGLGIKYDPTHNIRYSKCYDEYLLEMALYGDKFYHFHIKGTLLIDGERYDDPPAGMDLINWGAVFDILYTKNYKGTVSIEPHSAYWKGVRGKWGVQFTTEYIKKFIMPEDLQ